jgi:hypothetical protein
VSQPQASTPFPPGTTEQVIWTDADGRVLPGQENATGGEIVLTFPDGRVEHTIFTTAAAED